MTTSIVCAHIYTKLFGAVQTIYCVDLFMYWCYTRFKYSTLYLSFSSLSPSAYVKAFQIFPYIHPWKLCRYFLAVEFSIFKVVLLHPDAQKLHKNWSVDREWSSSRTHTRTYAAPYSIRERTNVHIISSYFICAAPNQTLEVGHITFNAEAHLPTLPAVRKLCCIRSVREHKGKTTCSIRLSILWWSIVIALKWMNT